MMNSLFLFRQDVKLIYITFMHIFLEIEHK